jgi:hypothetical protein
MLGTAERLQNRIVSENQRQMPNHSMTAVLKAANGAPESSTNLASFLKLIDLLIPGFTFYKRFVTTGGGAMARHVSARFTKVGVRFQARPSFAWSGWARRC